MENKEITKTNTQNTDIYLSGNITFDQTQTLLRPKIRYKHKRGTQNIITLNCPSPFTYRTKTALK